MKDPVFNDTLFDNVQWSSENRERIALYCLAAICNMFKKDGYKQKIDAKTFRIQIGDSKEDQINKRMAIEYWDLFDLPIREKKKTIYVIAVDFDGTLFENNWPDIGKPKWKIINELKKRKKNGTKIILNTMREGDSLQEAITACYNVGITFDSVNDNIPEMKKAFNNNPRKIFANEYWDDHSVPLDRIGEETETDINDDIRIEPGYWKYDWVTGRDSRIVYKRRYNKDQIIETIDVWMEYRFPVCKEKSTTD